jgi:hypothetical protein
MDRILEIVVATLFLVLIAPLTAFEWVCRRLSQLFRALSFRELRTFLIRVMRGEERLVRLWTVFVPRVPEALDRSEKKLPSLKSVFSASPTRPPEGASP